MPYATLDDRGLIRLSGEEAVPFLQGLVSNDVRPVQQGKAVYAALLSPQGRFLHDFFLLPSQDAILLDTAKNRLPELLQRLKMYRLRSKVDIEPLPELQVTAVWEQDAGIAFADPRLPELGFRIIGASTDLG
ncbi:MAG: folate-binding protein, partial [Pseudomonadota bacterium]|nr:folate-binding protein [Pseudomonadota bacterium]